MSMPNVAAVDIDNLLGMLAGVLTEYSASIDFSSDTRVGFCDFFGRWWSMYQSIRSWTVGASRRSRLLPAGSRPRSTCRRASFGALARRVH